MSTSSLRIDEIGSVDAYTRRGPFIAATTYNAAKNHTFFSIVNSVTPGSGSHNPLRARIWSFVAVVAILGLLLWLFWRRRRYTEGAIAFAFVALNPQFLEIALEARGYGFISLAALIFLAAFESFLATDSDRSRRTLIAVSILGIYTLPYFVVFAGPALLVLFLLKPTMRTVTIGVWAATIVAFLYLPVAGDVADVAAEYTDVYGLKFTTMKHVFEALGFCVPENLFRLDSVHLFGFIALLLLLPLALRRERTPTVRTLHVGFALVAIFYAFCLVLQSPPQRVTSFLGAPFAFLVATALALVIRHPLLIPIRPVLAVALLVPLISFARTFPSEYTLVPREKWKEAGQMLDVLFPGKETTIWMEELRHSQLSAYLKDRSRVRFERPLDLKRYESGHEVAFDAAHNRIMTPIDPATLPDPTFVVPFVVRSGTQKLFFHDPGAATVQIGGQIPEIAPGESVDFRPTNPASRVLLVQFEERIGADTIHVAAVRGASETSIPEAQTIIEGTTLIVERPENSDAIRVRSSQTHPVRVTAARYLQ
jgi:hypothetical protein